MKINKVAWDNSGSQIRFTLPMSKVNEERREVSGFASLDNPDEQGDIVMAEASTRAFSRFRGNIREMHQPIAVGKMVSFKEDEYFDPKTKQNYKGVFVTVKVSKGAQDTWEKVLDGTLTGFSIGGSIVDQESVFVKSTDGGDGKSIRLIKEFDLTELSLVDNPANQLANVFSIQKSVTDELSVTGMIADTNTEVVFYCKEDGIAKCSSEDSMNCPQCGNKMEDAGWFEYSEESERVSKMAECLDKFTSREAANTTSEGGAEEMAKANKPLEDPIEVVEQGKAKTEVDSSVEEVAAEAAEEAEEVSEVESETTELSKMMDDLKDSLEQGMTENLEQINAKVSEVNKSFEEFGKSMESKFSELEPRLAELSGRIAGLKENIDGVEKSMKVLESKTAIKKSGDLGGSTEQVVEKGNGFWGNTFLGED